MKPKIEKLDLTESEIFDSVNAGYVLQAIIDKTNEVIEEEYYKPAKDITKLIEDTRIEIDKNFDDLSKADIVELYEKLIDEINEINRGKEKWKK